VNENLREAGAAGSSGLEEREGIARSSAAAVETRSIMSKAVGLRMADWMS
jgi:hypothetical protein